MGHDMREKILESSANNMKDKISDDHLKSFIYSMKRRGPRREP